ncbi:metallopeptidase family protein [Populibacterium corticicola]|uniref:Metallopeptidase family protein n=1 Tax=Populibacterium corticicola TaxID=1812826 RepID=A0ABW5XGX8_9MICO
MVEMSREEFELAVSDALDQLPADLVPHIDNVVVFVEGEPPAETPDLLGVYDGVPLTERGFMWGAGALPDRITIYMNPTLRMCESVEEVVEEVLVTVVHEVAHYFGIDDDRLHELGWA